MHAIRIALWCAVALALFVLGALTVGGFALPYPGRDSGATLAGSELEPGAALGGAFTLVDQRGEPIDEAIFRGKPSVTLFGFTHCPDVCPTGLMRDGALGGRAGRGRRRASASFSSPSTRNATRRR